MFLAHRTNNIAEVARRWQELACNEHQTALVRRTLRNGSTATVNQCKVCGVQVGSPLKRLSAHDQLPDFDAEIQASYAMRRRTQHRDISRELDDKARALWKLQYDDYLRSPDWAERRTAVLERENHLCQGCRKAQATQAHHTTYKNVGEEFLFELVALCRPCHERFHEVYMEAIDSGPESYDENLDDS